MMYLQHDFYSNFSKSLQSGDSQMTYDLLVDELSELIVHDHKKIFDLLHKVDVKVRHNASDEQLVDSLLKELKENEKLTKGLSFLIAERNNLISNKTDQKSGKKYIDYVNKNLKNVFKTMLSENNQKGKFKSDVINRVKVKASKVSNRGRNITSPSKYWRNVIILAGVGVGIYLLYKHREKIFGNKEAEALADGGAIVPPVGHVPDVVPPVSNLPTAPPVDANIPAI